MPSFIRSLISLLVATTACGQSAQSLVTSDWTRPIPPFRIIGNVYWVGTYDLSTFLITTPSGHILINSGLAETVPAIRAGIEQLGFKISDVKILTASHGHFDHVAGFAELKRLTGARVVISAPDASLLESGGKTDFRFGNDSTAAFAPVTVDRKLNDGDRVELGGVTLVAHIHPGHTRGATTFTFDVREQDKVYRVAIVNMPSINPGVSLAGMPGFPNIADAYAHTFREQNRMQFDIWLAPHAVQFGMHQKLASGGAAFRPDRFIDPQGYQAAISRLEAAYQRLLAKDARK